MHGLTISEILKRSEQLLQDSTSPRLDAEVLLADALRCNRARLYARADDIPPAADCRQYTDRLDRRLQGHPVAYITGQREFWSMALKVNRHTLIPRPETECLVEAALQLIPENTAMTIAEPGTGSGAIALALAKERPQCRIIATDIDADTLAVAALNIEHHRAGNISLRQSDWFATLQDQQFDLVISNPPYIRDSDPHLHSGDVRFEPRHALAAGPDGMDMLNRIIDTARDALLPGGCLLLEHGFDQGDKVSTRMRDCGYHEINPVIDLAGHHRGTSARWTP